MISRSLQAARPLLARAIAQQTPSFAYRSLFTPSAIRQADLVQQLYLKEIQAFKPTPIKPTDSEGHVQQFAVPKAPTSPEEANIANELKDYETQQPDIEGSAAPGTAPVVEDWFEEEEDVAAPSSGH